MREGFDPRDLESIPPVDQEPVNSGGSEEHDDSKHWREDGQDGKGAGARQHQANYGSLGDSNVWDGSR